MLNFCTCYASTKVNPIKDFIGVGTPVGFADTATAPAVTPYDQQATAAGFGPLNNTVKAAIRTWAATIHTGASSCS